MRMVSATRAGAIFAVAVGGFAGAAPGAPGDALVVTANQVNVRTEPSTSGRIWVRVDRDEPAIELGREGEWVRVELPRQETTGWIHQSLLSVVAAGSAPAAEAAAVDEPPAAGDAQVEAPATEAPPAADTESEAAPVDAPVPAMPVLKPDAMAATPAEGAGESTATEAAPAEVATETAVTEAVPTPAVEAPAPTTEAPTSAVAAVEPSDPIALERFRTSVSYLNDRALAAAGIDLFSGVEQVGAGTAQIRVTDAWSMMPPSGRQSYLNILFDRWLAATGARGPLSVQIVDPSGQVADQKSGP